MYPSCMICVLPLAASRPPVWCVSESRSHRLRVSLGNGTHPSDAAVAAIALKNEKKLPAAVSSPEPLPDNKYASRNGATCSAKTHPLLARRRADTALQRLCSKSSFGFPPPNTNTKMDSINVVSLFLFFELSAAASSSATNRCRSKSFGSFGLPPGLLLGPPPPPGPPDPPPPPPPPGPSPDPPLPPPPGGFRPPLGGFTGTPNTASFSRYPRAL
mmetsp:Transcript_6210/g.20815  ORF Transcript_6210/g.20815 Transcript_6210/m.20815 type:complete len:215 (+) Transcript_6210:964-1608(+)